MNNNNNNNNNNNKLSCPLCLNLHFDGVDTLRATLIAVATSEIACPVCQEILKGLDKFTIHLFTHNISNENDVSSRTSTSEMAMAAAAAATVSSQFPVREQQQIVESSLLSSEAAADGIEVEITNAQLVLANQTRTLRCDICMFTFSDANILDMHQKLLHQTLEDTDGVYSYHCHLCSKKFKMKGSLMVHLRVAHYGFGGSGSDLIVHSLQTLKTSEDNGSSDEPAKKWSCDGCNKLFTTKYFLKKHKRLHTGEMPYFCAECNKYFTFQQSYRKHMLYHSTEKPHVCSQCGRAFKELSTLHNHERIHSGERPFACESCGKCFRQRVSYLVHKRIHTGVMPYRCVACSKTFRYKVSQRSHKCPVSTAGNEMNATTCANPISEMYATTCTSTMGTSGNESDVNTNANIVFNADGQIIGQNFTFDGANLITYTTNRQVAAEEQPTASDNNMNANKLLQTINEESLKQLLYGPVNSDNNNYKL